MCPPSNLSPRTSVGFSLLSSFLNFSTSHSLIFLVSSKTWTEGVNRKSSVWLGVNSCHACMTIDPRIPTMPGRSTSGFYRRGRCCLHQGGAISFPLFGDYMYRTVPYHVPQSQSLVSLALSASGKPRSQRSGAGHSAVSKVFEARTICKYKEGNSTVASRELSRSRPPFPPTCCSCQMYSARKRFASAFFLHSVVVIIYFLRHSPTAELLEPDHGLDFQR